MIVLFTSAARADLTEIADHIARDDPARAEAFVGRLIATCEAIADFPFGAPAIPRYADRGYRRKVCAGYLIVYRVGSETIEIVRVLHGARDLVRLLGEAGR